MQAPPTVSPEVETTFAPTLTPTVDVDAEKTRAYEKGRAQGLAEMRGEMERLQQDIQVLNPILTELATAKKRAVTSANETIASLVLALAHRIAGDSLALHPDALPQLVKRTLERLPEEDEIWVRVPPDDVKRVADSLGPRHRVKVLGDEHITAGCVIETRQAQVDCTLDAAMQGLEGAVRTWLESMA